LSQSAEQIKVHFLTLSIGEIVLRFLFGKFANRSRGTLNYRVNTTPFGMFTSIPLIQITNGEVRVMRCIKEGSLASQVNHF